MNRVVLAVAFSLTALAQTFRVAGAIIDDQSGSPVARAQMILSDASRHDLTMMTAADGRFSFDVPEGKYSLLAERRGWRMTYGALTSSATVASSVFTGPNKDTQHLVFRWFAPGAVFGKILDERGEPVEAATVQLIRQRIVAGIKHTATVAYGQTDDLGNYRFAPMAGGTYYLSVTGAPWFAAGSNVFLQSNHTEPRPPELVFVPSFYPSASDPADAAPLVLKPGADVEANFTLRTAAGARVTATCEACTSSLALYFQGPSGVELFRTWVTISNAVPKGGGPMMMGTAVPPGHYMARFNASGKSMNKAIDIGAADVTIEVLPKPNPTVSGKVTFPNQFVPHGTVYVRLVDDATGAVLSRVVEHDGTFSWTSVAAARYQPIVAGDGLFMSQISTEGASLKDGLLEVADGDVVRLSITASNTTGRLKGFVMRDDKPVPAAMVALVGKNLPKDPTRYRMFQTDSDGSFDLQSVPAGDYLLFAVEGAELEYKNPEALRPYLPASRPFRIESGRVYNERLDLSPLPQR